MESPIACGATPRGDAAHRGAAGGMYAPTNLADESLKHIRLMNQQPGGKEMDEAQAKRVRPPRGAAQRKDTVPLMLVDPRWNPNAPIPMKKVCECCESTFTPYPDCQVDGQD